LQGRIRGMIHLHPDVFACCDVGRAFGLHHHSADFIDQDGRPWNALSRLKVPYLVGSSILPAPHLRQTQGVQEPKMDHNDDLPNGQGGGGVQKPPPTAK